jgi:uncharacterized protein (DUF2384 family)
MANKTLTPTDLIERLAKLIGGADNAQRWLNTPHPFLDSETPQFCLDEGKLEVIDYIVHCIEVGQPG